MTCLVSGGADSTCLWHALRALGYDVSAVHVHHGLAGRGGRRRRRALRERSWAPRSSASSRRRPRRRCATPATRRPQGSGSARPATPPPTRSRRCSTGSSRAARRAGSRRGARTGSCARCSTSRARRRARYCLEHGLPVRVDETNADTKRGLIRRRDPAAVASPAPGRRREPARARRGAAAAAARRSRARSSSSSRRGPARGGRPRRRRPRRARVRHACGSREPWSGARGRSRATAPASRCAAAAPGDRLAGRRKKVQDLLVDAKVPSADRDAWPVVVHGEEVVAVPGIATAPGWDGVVTARRSA